MDGAETSRPKKFWGWKVVFFGGGVGECYCWGAGELQFFADGGVPQHCWRTINDKIHFWSFLKFHVIMIYDLQPISG